MDYILAVYVCGCIVVAYLLLEMFTKYHNDMKHIPLFLKVFISIGLILCSWLVIFFAITKQGDEE